MDVAGAFDKFVQDAQGFIGVFKIVSGENFFPFGVSPFELSGELGRGGDEGGFSFEQLIEDTAYGGHMFAPGGFEILQSGKAHEASQAFAGRVVAGDGMSLAVVLHLEAMLEVAEEDVGLSENARILGGEQFVLDEFLQARQGLGTLEERLAAGMKELEGLGGEFDFADAAAAQLHVAVELAGSDDLVFDAVLHGGDFGQHAFVDGARVTEGLDHFEELGGERLAAGDAAGFDEHHALPGLAPLRVIIFVAGERTAERAAVAFGPEAQVDAVKGAFGGHARDLGDEGFGKAIEEGVIGEGGFGRFAFGRGLAERAPFLGIDEDDINVRAVIELVAAELAEAEDAGRGGVPGTGGVRMERLAVTFGELAKANLPDDIEANVGDIGEFLDDLGHAAESSEVAGGDAEHLLLFELADTAEGGGEIAGLEQLREPGIDFVYEALFAAGIADDFRVERTNTLRPGDEPVAEGLGAAEQGGKEPGEFG